MKNIQMPADVFIDLYLYFNGVLTADSYPDYQERVQRIVDVLNAKFDALDRRQTFSDYKTSSAGSDEREAARRKYLEKSGVHKDWRTETEMKNQ